MTLSVKTYTDGKFIVTSSYTLLMGVDKNSPSVLPMYTNSRLSLWVMESNQYFSENLVEQTRVELA